MRILHTSDWHLGRILHGIHLTEEQEYILEQFVQVVKDEKPDVVVIAGDIYDRSVPPVEAVELFDKVLNEILIDCNTPIIAIAGNHDSADRINFASKLLKDKGLYIQGKVDLKTEPIVIKDEYGSVYFHLLPYIEPAIVKSVSGIKNIHSHDDAMKVMTDNIRDNMDKSKRNVLVGHAFVIGGEISDSERPLSVGGSGVVGTENFKDFDYIALGHLHRPQKIGSEKIRYSGSLMKYSFSEANQKKSIYIVDMDVSGNVKIVEKSLKPKRDLKIIKGYLDNILEKPEDYAENLEDYLMVNLLDEGALLDAMGKLRSVFPNTLRIEREQFKRKANEDIKTLSSDYNEMSDEELFKSFYKQVTGRQFAEEKQIVLDNILKEIYTERG